MHKFTHNCLLLHGATNYNGRVSDAITKPDKEKVNMFAQAVEAILTQHKWSLRAAQTYTGVHASTVDRMRKGIAVEPEAIIQFARASSKKGEEVQTARRLLKLAGKDDITSLIEAVERAARNFPADQTQKVLSPTGETVEVLVTDDGPGIEFDATPENLEVIASVMRAVRKAQQ